MKKDSVSEQLWQLVDEKRRTHHPSLVEIVKDARTAKIPVGSDELRALVQKLYPHDYALLPPNSVIEFIKDYVKDIQVESVLDPWAGLGSLLIPVIDATKAIVAKGISPNPEALKIASLITGNRPISWILSDPLDGIDQLKDNFDLIVSCPPLGFKPIRISIESDQGPLVLNDDLGNLCLIKACLRLRENGVAFFIVLPNFMKSLKENSVYSSLAKCNIFVEAMLSIPAGSFAHQTGVETALIIIRRTKPNLLFVGELSEDIRRNHLLLKNLKSGECGKEIPLGYLIDHSKFKSYRALVSEHRVKEVAKASGLNLTRISEIITGINLSKSVEHPGFEDLPNAVYLPLIGRSDAVTSTLEFSLKPHNYVQILVDPTKAEALYIAKFFNSKLGQMVREQGLTGNFILKLNKQSINELDIYLPQKNIRIDTIETDTSISNLINELIELQKRLWFQPLKVDKFRMELNKINKEGHQEECFDDWLETLPYPLATILWTCNISRDNNSRFKNLLHFFEALSEYHAIVLLSGFKKDPDLFYLERRKIGDVLSSNHLSLERATFGTWLRIVERLSKSGRKLLNGNLEERQRLEEMFRTSNTEVLEMLFSKELIVQLQKAVEIRNLEDGHSGIVGVDYAREKNTVLLSYLNNLMRIFSRTWENYLLIKPGSNRCISGIYHYQVERLMGSRYPFKPMEIRTSKIMDESHYYLYSIGELKPLKFLPLIKLRSSPKSAQNACYFYNKVEPEFVHFVSYHFEPEPKLDEPFIDTVEALRDIYPNKGEFE